MEVYLVRHTTPDVQKGICYGQSELELMPSFELELNNIMTKLPQRIDRVYSSPWSRCFRLAKQITTQSLVYDYRLSELNFGKWEMRPWNEVPREWYDDFVATPCENGESYLDLNNRVQEFWSEIIQKKSNVIVIVTHASVIRAIVSHVLDLKLINSFNFDVSYGSVTKVSINSGWPKLNFLNN